MKIQSTFDWENSWIKIPETGSLWGRYKKTPSLSFSQSTSQNPIWPLLSPATIIVESIQGKNLKFIILPGIILAIFSAFKVIDPKSTEPSTPPRLSLLIKQSNGFFSSTSSSAEHLSEFLNWDSFETPRILSRNTLSLILRGPSGREGDLEPSGREGDLEPSGVEGDLGPLIIDSTNSSLSPFPDEKSGGNPRVRRDRRMTIGDSVLGFFLGLTLFDFDSTLRQKRQINDWHLKKTSRDRGT